MDLDEISKLMGEDSLIFHNELVFKEDYVPTTLKYRDKQLIEMSKFSKIMHNGVAPSNLALLGDLATGKSSSLKIFLLALDTIFDNLFVVNLNCRFFNTENAVYGEIYKKIKGNKVNILGRRNTDLFKEIISYIHENNLIFILVLDDLHCFDNVKDLNKILSKFLRISEQLNDIQISIWTISNYNSIELNRDVESIFNRQPIYFDNYSKEDMFNILKDRAFYGFNEGVISDELIEEIATNSFENTDLRDGIRVLYNAGLNAESAGNNKIIKEYIVY